MWIWVYQNSSVNIFILIQYKILSLLFIFLMNEVNFCLSFHSKSISKEQNRQEEIQPWSIFFLIQISMKFGKKGEKVKNWSSIISTNITSLLNLKNQKFMFWDRIWRESEFGKKIVSLNFIEDKIINLGWANRKLEEILRKIEEAKIRGNHFENIEIGMNYFNPWQCPFLVTSDILSDSIISLFF